MPNLREDQWLIHAQVDGVNFPSTFSWTTMSGGDIEAQDTKTRPGGMLPEQSLGGPTTRSDCTVERNYNSALHAYIVQLENAAGRATGRVSYTPLDANGNPSGGTVTLHGLLKGVKPPDKNANNTGAAFLALTFSCQVAASISA